MFKHPSQGFLSVIKKGLKLKGSDFNRINQTITVQPGMMGPDYEYLLNHAPEKLKAGQASSLYGDAADLVMAPWMEGHLGKAQMDILRAIKAHMDPNGIMNPGGLGL